LKKKKQESLELEQVLFVGKTFFPKLNFIS
jgi:hypothetical protein